MSNILPIAHDKDIILNALSGCLENERAGRLEREARDDAYSKELEKCRAEVRRRYYE